MKYVFFDIECANCYQGKGKICSFGYVITNENFDVEEKYDMIINPDSKFNLGPDIKLAYTKSEFRHASQFPMFYDEIDALLTDPDAMIFGFSANNDARYIRDECIRYELPHIDYVFYDVQQMYMGYDNTKNQPSLVGICDRYGIPESQDVHKSDDDAFMTMEVLRNLCSITNKTVSDLIRDYPRSVGEMKNGEFRWVNNPGKEEKNQKNKKTKMNKSNQMRKYSANYRYFLRFCNSLVPSENEALPLYGKRVCISVNYEERHFSQMLSIAEQISMLGGKYDCSSDTCDLFVKYELIKTDGTPKKCPRLAHVIEKNNNGDNIAVIDFEDFLGLTGIDPERRSSDSENKPDTVYEDENMQDVI